MLNTKRKHSVGSCGGKVGAMYKFLNKQTRCTVVHVVTKTLETV